MILQVVDGAACIPFGKVDRNKRLGFVIKPAFFLLVRVKSRRQSKAEGEIQRDGLNQKAGRGYFKLFAEEIDHPFAGHRGKLQADHIQPAAFFEHFLHNAAEVDVKIDRDIRIAGNTHDVFFHHLLLTVQLLGAVEDDVGGEQHAAALVKGEDEVGWKMGKGDDAQLQAVTLGL